MRTLTEIIGYSTDQNISDRLHSLSHDGLVEYIILERDDTLRRRLRATTDKGTDCAIALTRDQKLEDGSVLSLDNNNAIVVRMVEEKWISIKPADMPSAIELGYFAGNLHWRVRFEDKILHISQEGPLDFYMDRLGPFIDAGKIEILSE